MSNMQVPFLDLKEQHRELAGEILALWRGVLESAWFVGGEHVTSFEHSFADACGVAHCIAVGSGTDALRFPLLAMRLEPGDEVITAPNTFIATTEAISQAGGRPVFVDIDSATYNLDPKRLEAAIKHFREALRLDKDFAHAHVNLGTALLRTGELDEAIKHHRVATVLEPVNALAHHHLGCSLQRKGEREKAIDHLQKVIQLKPDFALAHYALGTFLGGMGEQDRAIEQYEEAIQLDPKLTLARNILAWSLMRAEFISGCVITFICFLRPVIFDKDLSILRAVSIAIVSALLIMPFPPQ